ncbi:cytidylyltransferase domain-containing protein [Thalassospira povalilytica]|uniref:acylneuraminate cytidylyltransferase family protein n=1 Tax=Thalassospira povalilytica TaxID=732237 RepID=UPI003AA93277
MLAYIPARGGSQRIPRKNIRLLGGKPIVAHVIEQVLQLTFVTDVFVSTDDAEIKDVAESFGAQCGALRDPCLSNSKAGFIDLIKQDIPRYCREAEDDEVLFCLATAALVPSEVYISAYEEYTISQPDILMSCEPYPEPVWWALQQKEDGYWHPMYPDKVLINSQDLPKTLTDSGLFYFFNQRNMNRFSSHKIVEKLQAFEVPHQYRCDVNDEEDWERLEWKFQRLNYNKE